MMIESEKNDNNYFHAHQQITASSSVYGLPSQIWNPSCCAHGWPFLPLQGSSFRFHARSGTACEGGYMSCTAPSDTTAHKARANALYGSTSSRRISVARRGSSSPQWDLEVLLAQKGARAQENEQAAGAQKHVALRGQGRVEHRVHEDVQHEHVAPVPQHDAGVGGAGISSLILLRTRRASRDARF